GAAAGGATAAVWLGGARSCVRAGDASGDSESGTLGAWVAWRTGGAPRAGAAEFDSGSALSAEGRAAGAATAALEACADERAGGARSRRGRRGWRCCGGARRHPLRHRIGLLIRADRDRSHLLGLASNYTVARCRLLHGLRQDDRRRLIDWLLLA